MSRNLDFSKVKIFTDLESVTDRIKNDVIVLLKEYFETDDKFPYYTNDSGLIIEDRDTFNKKTVGAKPRIVIVRQDFRWANLSLNDFAGLSSLDNKTPEYLDHANGEIICNCMSANGLEAEILAAKVFMIFRALKQEIREEFDIFHIDSSSIGAEQRILNEGNQPALRNVPVTLSYMAQVSWYKKFI